MFRRELGRWQKRGDLTVLVTVDHAPTDWTGRVGVVTALLSDIAIDPGATVAFVCGPEVMMRFTVRELGRRGVADDRIYLSMERNMKCAVGFCGHCQLGPSFICKDGPVLRYDRIRFDYDDFRDLRVTGVAPGTEPLYTFDADVIRLYFSGWF